MPLLMRVTRTTPKLFSDGGSKTLLIPHGSSVVSGWAKANGTVSKTKPDEKSLQMTLRQLHDDDYELNSSVTDIRYPRRNVIRF